LAVDNLLPLATPGEDPAQHSEHSVRAGSAAEQTPKHAPTVT